MLSQGPAFAALPGLKPPAPHQSKRDLVSPNLVVQSTKLNTQIIPLLHLFEVPFQFAQSLFWRFPQPFPKLVTLVKQA